jgi:O-antigen ligase
MSVADSGILLAGPRRRPGLPAIRLVEAFAYALLAAFIFFICFTFLRPSPYDFFAIPAMALWFCLGIRLHRSSVTFVALLLAYHLGLLISLLPYFDEPRTVEWTYQSVYLMLTAIFFAMLFSDDTAKRIEFVLKAYLASCLFAAAAGIASYYDLFDGILFKMDGRAAGVFEDPNVLGSFLIPGALYLLHNLIGGRSRVPLFAAAWLALIAAGIFFSFSRGSWLAMVVATATMVALMYRTSLSARLRARIVAPSVATIAICTVTLAGALTVGDIAERFEDRAQLTKDYDEGVTGRFGNQLRSGKDAAGATRPSSARRKGSAAEGEVGPAERQGGKGGGEGGLEGHRIAPLDSVSRASPPTARRPCQELWSFAVRRRTGLHQIRGAT